MARESLAPLIERVRGLIGDPAKPANDPRPSQFSDNDIEAALDAHRFDMRLARLTPRETIVEGGAVEYREYFSYGGDWEANVTLQGASYETLTPTESYPMQGRWVFNPPVQTGTVYVQGTQYDVYAAAADLVDTWAARTTLEFDFSRGSRSYKRSQKREGLRNLAKSLRSKQRIGMGEQVRYDSAY